MIDRMLIAYIVAITAYIPISILVYTHNGMEQQLENRRLYTVYQEYGNGKIYNVSEYFFVLPESAAIAWGYDFYHVESDYADVKVSNDGTIKTYRLNWSDYKYISFQELP